LALLLAARGIGHRHVVALELGLQVAALLLDAPELRVARGELALELLLRALRGGGLAEHALGVHEADLHVGGAGAQCRAGERRRHTHGRRAHQKILPSWNWKRSILSSALFLIGAPKEKRRG